MTKEKDDFLVDAVISAGELSESGYTYLDNELRVVEVAKHNIPYSEFLKWRQSDACRKRMVDLVCVGKRRFGVDSYLKYKVDCFCTLPHKD